MIRGWAGRPEYGNSLLVREPLAATDAGRLDLGLGRAAHRARIVLPGGATVLVAITHLHHVVDGDADREVQATTMLDWLSGAPPAGAVIVMGDFNADPVEATVARMKEAGFRSAFAEANGREPAITWPSGLQAPAMDTDGDPDCLDYIWVRGDVRVVAARLVFDRPHPDDPTLYPSDHLGISATLQIGAGRG
ncbi:MAG: endonuclease/exonuclease/phosphatase family protein [Candidatus Limnocylindrales bacterium]